MAQYQFRFELFGSSGPLEEQVTAADADEARNLAELRLLMSHDIRRLTVCQSGTELLHLDRERRFDPDLSQDLSAARRQGVSAHPAEGAGANV
ncbi:MAG: hypothetical protein EON59_11695 [Alphaproteobacteria bacterium]|nr:MAG: hypothetical protein EON59_11695 [Alphaproteobacteria bacterium]